MICNCFISAQLQQFLLLNSGISISINCVTKCDNYRKLACLKVILLPLFSVPVIWTHGTCKNNFPGKFSVSFPQEISCIFHSALPDQLRNQPEVSRSYQIAQASFYQTDSLSLRRYSFKKSPDALPGILPDRSFCGTAVFRNNYGNDILSHLPHRQLNSLSESLFRHRSYLH